jgi:hypothetical protein
MSRSLLAVLSMSVAVAVGGWCHEARAQGADTERAIGAGREAALLFEAGKWEEALRRFEEADAAAHSVVFVLYMARCQRELGDLAAALRLLESAAAEPLPADASEPMRRAQADATAELTEVREEMRVRAEETARQERASEVRLPSPLTGVPARPGTPGSMVPGAIALGVGAIGLGIGVVTGSMALSETSSIEEGCEGTHCLRSDAPRGDRASTLATVSTVAFIAGGAAAAAGVVLLVVRPGGTPHRPASPVVVVSAGPRGAWAMGRF